MRRDKTPKKFAKFGNQAEFLDFFRDMSHYGTLEIRNYTWEEKGGIYKLSFPDEGWKDGITLPFGTFERIGVQVTYNPG